MTYPIALKQATGLVDSIPTSVSIHSFSDKILITITETQSPRLAQWFLVPFTSASPTHRDTYLPPGNAGGGSSEDRDEDLNLLPPPHLSARTLLGGSTPEREAIGQLFAVQIASAISLRDPGETRAVLLGLGLGLGGRDMATPSREMFFDLMDLVVQCL